MHSPWRAMLWALGVLILLGLIVRCSTPQVANAQDLNQLQKEGQNIAGNWYAPQCCSTNDCHPARDGDVRESDGGYHVDSLNKTVPYGNSKIRQSHDWRYHICAGKKSGNLYCLYVPPGSM